MRLDDFDTDSIDVEDQRGGGFGIPLRGGGLGCGGLLVVIIASYALGVDPGQLVSGLEQIQQQQQGGPSAPEAGRDEAGSCNADAGSLEACKALSSLNKTWQPVFEQAGVAFRRPGLVFYSQYGQSGCGSAQSAMGPFYCPEDQKIYLDTDFFKTMDQQLGAGGQFARDYVIAHEFGHHIQRLTGVTGQIRRLQQADPSNANQYSVRLELQADCYAGVWAAKNADRIEPGDMESGLNAAHQIGDDTLMKSAGRNPNEAAFTHGSSQQRVEWLRRGMESRNDSACDALMNF